MPAAFLAVAALVGEALPGGLGGVTCGIQPGCASRLASGFCGGYGGWTWWLDMVLVEHHMYFSVGLHYGLDTSEMNHIITSSLACFITSSLACFITSSLDCFITSMSLVLFNFNNMNDLVLFCMCSIICLVLFYNVMPCVVS